MFNVALLLVLGFVVILGKVVVTRRVAVLGLAVVVRTIGLVGLVAVVIRPRDGLKAPDRSHRFVRSENTLNVDRNNSFSKPPKSKTYDILLAIEFTISFVLPNEQQHTAFKLKQAFFLIRTTRPL